jgi:hypothetical protein
MSQSTVAARPAVRPAPRPAARQAPRGTAPRLRVVSAPLHARSRAGLVVASLVLLTVGLVGLLLLNVSLEKGAFVRRTQLAQIEQLSEQRESLLEQIAAREAPQSLASRAASLGMVEAPNVAFIRSDGRILGVPSPGVAAGPQGVTPSASSDGGQGSGAGARATAKGPSAGAAGPAGKATASAKVTATGKAAAATAAASTGKRASSPAAAKAPPSTTAVTARAAAGKKATARVAATMTATP